MRILTYNIRHAQGIGGLISLKRIGRVISGVGADLVALNEVYRWAPHFDQSSRLAELTGSCALFQKNVRHGPADYGNALLAHAPLRIRADLKLPGRGEPRGCMIADLELDGRTVCIAVTHLGLSRAARALQIEMLTRELPRNVPLVLVGDLNCTPTELSPLRAFMQPLPVVPPTYPSWRPWVAYDHILYSEHWTLAGAGTVRTLASDHLPLYADLHLGID